MANHKKLFSIILFTIIWLVIENRADNDELEQICEITPSLRIVNIVCSNTSVATLIPKIRLKYRSKNNVMVMFKDSYIQNITDSTFPDQSVFDRYRYQNDFTYNTIENFEIGMNTVKGKVENNIILNLTSAAINELRSFSSYRTLIINLSNNKIKYVSPDLFSKMSDILKIIKLDHCELTEIPVGVFSNNNRISTVTLSYNNFTKISEGTFSNGETNRMLNITTIGYSLSDKMTIDLDHCQITDIENGAFKGVNIRKLNISYNHIKNIADDTFIDCNILSIDLKNNKLDKINSNAFRKLGTFLQYLYLANNKISVLPAAMLQFNTELTTLDLTNNPIQILEPAAFTGLKRFRLISDQSMQSYRLSISNFKIKQIHTRLFYGLENLEKLNLSSRGIEVIFPEAFEGLAKLTHLNLSFNNIDKIQSSIFMGLNSIQVIDLSHNKISTIYADSFFGLEKTFRLLNISLSYNRIKQLPSQMFEYTPKLYALSLDHNNITQLENGIFSGLKVMGKLDLSYNKIQNIDKELLYPMTSLVHLNLDTNNLTHLDIKNILDHIRNLEYLNLNNNPWICTILEKMVDILISKKIDFLTTATEHYHLSNIHGIYCDNKTKQIIEDITTESTDIGSQLDYLAIGQDDLISLQMQQNTLALILNYIIGLGLFILIGLYIFFNRHLIRFRSTSSLARASENGSQVELINILK